MKTVSVAEARNEFESILDVSAYEPVLIEREDKDTSVLISIKEFKKWQIDVAMKEEKQLAEELRNQGIKRGLTANKFEKILQEIDP